MKYKCSPFFVNLETLSVEERSKHYNEVLSILKAKKNIHVRIKNVIYSKFINLKTGQDFIAVEFLRPELLANRSIWHGYKINLDNIFSWEYFEQSRTLPNISCENETLIGERIEYYISNYNEWIEAAADSMIAFQKDLVKTKLSQI